MHFIGEGEKTWVTKQLDKIISKAPSLLRASEGKVITREKSEESEHNYRSSKRIRKGSSKTKKNTNAPQVVSVKSTILGKDLASFIKVKKAGSNQRARFLATAAWLASKGKERFVTRDVTKAIDEAKLPKLVNASVNLSQNLKQGYLMKSGKEFMLSQKAKKVF